MKEVDFDLERKLSNNWHEYLSETKEVISTLKWIWKDLVNVEGKSWVKKMTLWLTAASLAEISLPWLLSFVFDGIRNLNRDYVIFGGVTFVVAGLMKILFSNRRRACREYVLEESVKKLEHYSCSKFFSKSLGMHLAENNDLCKENVRKGHEKIWSVKELLLFEAMEVLVTLAMAFLALWILNRPAAILATIVVLIHFVFGLFLNYRAMVVTTPFEKKWRALSRYNSERWQHIEKVKNSHQEQAELSEILRKIVDVCVPDRIFWIWYNNIASGRDAINFCIMGVIVAIGAWQAWHGQITLGLLFPIVSWSNVLLDRLWRIADVERQINFNLPSIISYKRVLELPDGLEPCDNPVVLPASPPQTIEFTNVGLTYMSKTASKGIRVLRDVSLRMNQGDVIGLIGKSGRGKTTLKRLLLRYFDATSGTITVDGTDLRKVDLESLLKQVGVISQTTQIFDGTIKYNLLYGVPDEIIAELTDDDLLRVLEQVHFDMYRLTDGLYTEIGRHGIELSGGQAQRLAMANVLLKDPPILIIDEGTSSLDATTEKSVFESLDILVKGRTVLIITHRLNTIRQICNKFVYLDGNGDNLGSHVVAVSNTFEGLAEQFPPFIELAHHQGIEL